MAPTRALTILRADHPAHTPETETTMLERDGRDIVITLDDGIELRWDALELRHAICDLTPVVATQRAA